MLSRGASLHDEEEEEEHRPPPLADSDDDEIAVQNVAAPQPQQLSDSDASLEGVPVAPLQEDIAAAAVAAAAFSLPALKPGLHKNSKYRASTLSPSDGDDVRWYFAQTPLGLSEAAASVPATEVVGKSEFLRFSLRDSLSLEEEFLKDEEHLLASWWKEYAECSEGPSRSGNDSFSRSTSEFYEDAVGVPVKGGLYEVDLIVRRCFPVYWNGEHRRVLRGHWFAQRALDWLPLREDIAEQLEFAYRCKVWEKRIFQPSGQFAARVDFQGATQGLHALFTGEEDTWEAWLHVDSTGISSMLGLSSAGFRLRRGFAASDSVQPSQEELRQRKEEEMDDYCSQVPVRHLVFMVHGIGQRLEKANLVDDVATFRRLVATLAEKHLTHYQRHRQRVLFIPCQWRRHLKLGGETAVEECTLEGVRALRTMVGATVHDVLYYMSPIYCQDIIDSVSSSLNRLFAKFTRRNPGYDGKISVYGHSLGSVLSYDILSHQEALVSSFPIQDVQTNVVETDDKQEQEQEQEQSVDVVEDAKAEEGKAEERKAEEGKAGEEEAGEEEAGEEETGEEKAEQEETGEEISEEEETGVVKGEEEETGEGKGEESDAEAPASDVVAGVKMEELVEELSALKAKLKRLEEEKSSRGHLQPSSSRRHHTPRINYTKLHFEVDTFFAVGSPLGLFLSLRNVRFGTGAGQEYWDDESIEEEMPCCRQMMNIFHPYDPVAYRVEPLISKDYVGKRPVFIPYHKGGKRLHIGMQEFGEDLGARSRALVSSLASVGTRVASAFSRSYSNKTNGDGEEGHEQRSYGSLVMERLTGSPEGRVDYMLQDATFEHQYIAAISSHTNYWRDPDTALFILRHFYRDVPAQSPEKLKQEEEAKSRLLSEYGGFIENDLPLTFSSKEGIAAEIAAADQSCLV